MTKHTHTYIYIIFMCMYMGSEVPTNMQMSEWHIHIIYIWICMCDTFYVITAVAAAVYEKSFLPIYFHRHLLQPIHVLRSC